MSKRKINLANLIKGTIELLSKNDWCRGVYAKDADGNKVDKYDKKAVCFCLGGALMRAEYDLGNYPLKAYDNYQPELFRRATMLMHEAVREEPRGEGAMSIADWNDNVCQNKSDALCILNKALRIEKAKRKYYESV